MFFVRRGRVRATVTAEWGDRWERSGRAVERSEVGTRREREKRGVAVKQHRG